MRVWLVVVLTALAACTSSLVSYEARVHVVQRGETLYKIAWQHGLDQRQLARWNGLNDPDLVRVGQRLRLTAPTAARAATSREQGSAARTATRRTPATTAPRTATPGTTNPAPARLPAEPPALPAPRWQWPTDGQVVSTFGSRTGIATGIGIGGRVGQTVRAAAPGRVVYAGSGLIGYGQLVIIKHNDTYLSAYGHNSRLLVTQGEDVERGEQIATMGVGPERQPRLHFEVRRNGVPVDPLQLLSARR